MKAAGMLGRQILTEIVLTSTAELDHLNSQESTVGLERFLGQVAGCWSSGDVAGMCPPGLVMLTNKMHDDVVLVGLPAVVPKRRSCAVLYSPEAKLAAVAKLAHLQAGLGGFRKGLVRYIDFDNVTRCGAWLFVFSYYRWGRS